MIRLKRAYSDPSPSDGLRVLVDRIWPRGLKKSEASVDLWLKELAPSSELRKWFAHDPEKWQEFRKRYFAELRSHQELVNELRARESKQRITLLFGSKEERFNNASALKEYLEQRVQ